MLLLIPCSAHSFNACKFHQLNRQRKYIETSSAKIAVWRSPPSLVRPTGMRNPIRVPSYPRRPWHSPIATASKLYRRPNKKKCRRSDICLADTSRRLCSPTAVFSDSRPILSPPPLHGFICRAVSWHRTIWTAVRAKGLVYMIIVHEELGCDDVPPCAPMISCIHYIGFCYQTLGIYHRFYKAKCDGFMRSV